MPQRGERIHGLVLAAGLLVGACRSEPGGSPAPAVPATAVPSVAQALPASPSGSLTAASGASSAAAPASENAAASASVAAVGSAAPAPASANLEPALLGADGAPLPQTEERPSVSSERFKRRMQQLADSILTGDAERARVTFFPLVAYAQVKAVEKPERDYKYRLIAHLSRDVQEYRKALGRDAERAEFLGVDVPEARAQWMKPGSEGNRLGYFRVLRSKLRFRLPGGAERSFELTSMISWRGEWYVVHLHGFE
jgi:hypothetical protein